MLVSHINDSLLYLKEESKSFNQYKLLDIFSNNMKNVLDNWKCNITKFSVDYLKYLNIVKNLINLINLILNLIPH